MKKTALLTSAVMALSAAAAVIPANASANDYESYSKSSGDARYSWFKEYCIGTYENDDIFNGCDLYLHSSGDYMVDYGGMENTYQCILAPKSVIGGLFASREIGNYELRLDYDLMLPLETGYRYDDDTDEVVDSNFYNATIIWKAAPYITAVLDSNKTSFGFAFDSAAAMEKYPDLKITEINDMEYRLSLGKNADGSEIPLTIDDGRELAQFCNEHIAKFTFTRVNDIHDVTFSKHPIYYGENADAAAEVFRAHGYEVTIDELDNSRRCIVPEEDMPAVEFYTILLELAEADLMPPMVWYDLAQFSVFRLELVGEPAGDANCDGKLTIADATAVLQSIGNPDKYRLSPQGRYNADLDDEKGITANDAVAIQLKVLKK